MNLVLKNVYIWSHELLSVNPMFSELQHSPSTQPSQDKTVQDPLTSKQTQLEESVGETQREQDQSVQQACTEHSISHKDQIEHIDTRDKEDMESDTLVLSKDETKVVESKPEEVVCKDNTEKNLSLIHISEPTRQA